MIKVLDMDTRDLRNKLGGCIFKIDGSVFILHRVAGVDEDDDEYGEDDEDYASPTSILFRGSTISEDGRLRWVDSRYWFRDDGNDPVIDLSYPQIGYVNYKKGAVYLQRKVARQWKMAYHPNNAQPIDRFALERFTCGISVGTALQEGILTRVNFVKRVFNRYYYNADAAYRMIRNGDRLGAAISPYVYIGYSMKFDDPLIVYKDKPVGYIDGNKSSINAYLFRPAEYVGKILPFHHTVVNDRGLINALVTDKWD